MYKNLCITDFFKSFAQPRQNKRPPDSSLDDSRAFKRSRSSTPDTALKVSTQNEADEDHAGTSGHDDSTGLRRMSSGTESVPGSSPHGSDSKEPSKPGGSSPEKVEALPSGSQGPVLVSSQRMIVNGEVIIKNSDDESDSEISLDDIDELLVARKPAVSWSSPTVTYPLGLPSLGPTELHGSVTRSKTKGATYVRTRQASPNLPARPTYKFSLNSLKRQNKDNEAAEAGSAEAWSLLQSVKETTSSQAAQIPTTEAEKVDANLVASVLRDRRDEEDIGKLMTAIHRTEAFHRGKTWSFFETTDDVALSTILAFPDGLDIRWHGILSDASTRDQAFLGGFIGSMASKQNLPDELLCWLLDAVCLESRGDLRSSYVHTIEEARTLITPVMTPARVNTLFQRIGASTTALNVSKPISPRVNYSQSEQDLFRGKELYSSILVSDVADWSKLVSILELLGRISNHLNMEPRRHTLCILCRLLLDNSIVQSCEVLIALEYAISNILSSIPDKEYEHEIQVVLGTVYPIVMDPTLRLQLLQNLPTCSPRLVIFRRRLALAYFFQDEHYLTKSATDLLDLRSVSEKLQNPGFAIRNDTNYPELAAIIGILSIGIDRGDPPLQSSDEHEKISFDADVDLLASRIGEMFTSIVDTGASHMKRTEAKEMLEAFHSKLLYAVRTKPKRKTMMFGESDALTLMQKKGFRGFFERKVDMQTHDL